MGIFSTIFGNKKNGSLKTVIKEGAFLVDVRSEIEFSSGSVNGAVNIPLEKFRHKLPGLKIKKILCYFAEAEAVVAWPKPCWSKPALKM